MLETHPTSLKNNIGSGVTWEDDFSEAVTVASLYTISTQIYSESLESRTNGDTL